MHLRGLYEATLKIKILKLELKVLLINMMCVTVSAEKTFIYSLVLASNI